MVNKEIIKTILEKYNIDLSKDFDCVEALYKHDIDFDKRNIVNYINSISKSFIDKPQCFNIQETLKYNLNENTLDIDITKEKIDLVFESEIVTEYNEHVQISDLGNFTVASKIKKDNIYQWNIYIKDKFNNNIEWYIIYNQSISNYLDAIVEYCELTNQKLPFIKL